MENETFTQKSKTPSGHNDEVFSVFFEEEYPEDESLKIPLSRISELGESFDSLASFVKNVLEKVGNAKSDKDSNRILCRVTFSKGTHLAKRQDGSGFTGATLSDKNEQLKGQATLTPLKFKEQDISVDPTMVYMATTLASINRKLTDIQELQQDMMGFLVQKEKSELRGNLIFLSEIANNYKYNWNNDLYKSSAHVKVFDIKQEAEQKIIFYQGQISSKLKKGTFFHSDRDARKMVEKVHLSLKEYQLALYLYAFSSFLDVMLLGNFDAEYLDGITRKIRSDSEKYQELYKDCCEKSETYLTSSIQSTVLKGLKSLSRATGKAIASSRFRNGTTDAALINTGDKIEKMEEQRTQTQMEKLSPNQKSYVEPFIDQIETVKRLQNNDIAVYFDQNCIFLCGAKA